MAWEDQNTHVQSAVRIKPESFPDAREFAAIPYVFGTRRVQGTAIEFQHIDTRFEWKIGDRRIEAAFDPIPVARRLERVPDILKGFRRSFADHIFGEVYEVPSAPRLRPPNPNISNPLGLLTSVGDHYYPKVRNSSILRKIHRLYPYQEPTDTTDRRPVGGAFGVGVGTNTIFDDAIKLDSNVDEIKSAANDMFESFQELYDEAIEGLDTPVPNDLYYHAPDAALFQYYLTQRSVFGVESASSGRGIPELKELVEEIISLANGLTALPRPNVSDLAAVRASRDRVQHQMNLVIAYLHSYDVEIRQVFIRTVNTWLNDLRTAGWLDHFNPENDRTHVLNYYTGRVAFSYGVIDKYVQLLFNETPMPQSPQLGDNTAIFPRLFGGAREDGGSGGIGSYRTENSRVKPQTIRLFDGDKFQTITRPTGTESNGADNYRGTAVMAFDTYNLGASSAPRIDAIVQRISRRRDGSNQWFGGKAAICDSVDGETRDFNVVFSLDRSGSMSNTSTARPNAPDRVFLEAFTQWVRSDIVPLINDGANINFYMSTWSHAVNSKTLTSAQILTEAASASPGWDFGGRGLGGTTLNRDGIRLLTADINAAIAAYPNSPVYALLISDPSSTQQFNSATGNALAPLFAMPNVEVRFIQMRSGAATTDEAANQLDENGAPYLHNPPRNPVRNPTLEQDLAYQSSFILAFLESLLLDASNMNPVHALREVLTDEEIGFGISEDRIDAVTFEEAAEKCYDEELCFSYVLSQQTDIDQVLTVLKEHINCEVYDHVPSNKIKIKLLRDDYDIDAIPSLGAADIGTVGDYSRSYNNQEIGGVTVSYTNFEGQQSAVTLLNPIFSSEGHEIIKVDYPGVPSAATALKIAERELASRSRATIYFSVTLASSDLYPGDPVKVTFPPRGLNNHVMRVKDRSIDEAGFVTLSLVQDVFADTPTEVSFQPYLRVPQRKFGWGYDWGNDWGN